MPIKPDQVQFRQRIAKAPLAASTGSLLSLDIVNEQSGGVLEYVVKVTSIEIWWLMPPNCSKTCGPHVSRNWLEVPDSSRLRVDRQQRGRGSEALPPGD
jgi:hypothetical protein